VREYLCPCILLWTEGGVSVAFGASQIAMRRVWSEIADTGWMQRKAVGELEVHWREMSRTEQRTTRSKSGRSPWEWAQREQR
jgi:hypothetical protein